MNKFLVLWKKYSFVVLMMFILLGLFDARIALLAIICMVAPIIVSLFKGRFWCGNLCPRGSFYDNVVSKFSNKRKVPKFLKSYYFRAIVFVGMMTMFGLGIKQNLGNLYGIGMVFYRMIVVTTIIGIVLSLFYNHRTWCNFCPMGSVASIISKFKKSKKVLQVSSSCVSCKMCEKKCPLGIVPYEYKGDILSHPDCIQCVSVCPKNAVGYDKITLK
ncbi:4Fe-4S binding protein [Clostridium botulinum]|uniref:4Fe-4S binding protein n=1 Tax=Clostridium botulinum TaxID=1491 RepID=UPI0014004806|nr:4Fe-4S binding protein [Clostridium botulinum]MBY6836971.1 4Fe-4S binding protein [Clostridium botulinum]NFG65695.1 4Fe-4S binding protein [Clostridium botulinum]NFQ23518.1 4Fe-4S binding protein [Clostridium botulinum]